MASPLQQPPARAAIQLFDSAFVHIQISDFDAPFYNLCMISFDLDRFSNPLQLTMAAAGGA